MFSKIYCRIWAIAFLVFGILSASGMHHLMFWGIHLDMHTLMWFIMALAHADVFWRKSH